MHAGAEEGSGQSETKERLEEARRRETHGLTKHSFNEQHKMAELDKQAAERRGMRGERHARQTWRYFAMKLLIDTHR